ncbi:MAG: hypothetical protein K9G41_02670 [Flavobacteriales bacterium]|nr:hypothetical protein [Flavobacteriales bacterium]
MRFYLHLCFVVLVLSVVSCQKKDTVSPSVAILQPLEGAVYFVYDTVFVSITAVDETELVSVTAKLVDANFIPNGAQSVVNINATTNTGAAELVIDDKLIETAYYYVLVTAFDGANEQREFRKIRIIGLPKERRAIYFSASSGNGMGAVYKLDSLFQASLLWVQLNQDVKKICINSLDDRLTLIGNYSTGLKTYDIKTGAVVWSDDVFPVAQTQRYMDVASYKRDVFTAIYDREIRKYNLSGGLNFNEPTGIYRPETIYVDDNYFVVEMELVGDNDHFLFVYHASTHALLWTLDVPMDVVAICELQDDEVLLFGNEGGNAKVLHYDMGNNEYWEPRQLPTGMLLSAVKMDGLSFAISHENGLYAYTYSPNYLNLMRSGIVYQNVCFDVDRNTLIAASGSSLEELSTIGQLINTVVHSDSITSIDIHYTR